MPHRGKLLVDDGLAVAVIDALTSQICVLDTDGVIIAVNRAWKEFAVSNGGEGEAEPLGINYLNVCSRATGSAADEAPEFMAGLRAVLSGETELFQMEYPCHGPQELRWFLARVSPLRRRDAPADVTRRRNSHNAMIGAVVSHMNITDRKRVEMDYARLAATDPLTGIPNRRFFEAFAKIEIDRYRRFGTPLSLLLIDLDRFKAINDTYGHLAGDEVLRRVAALGDLSFRDCDLFARLGGEEFACLMPGTDEAGARLAAERFRAALEATTVDVAGQAIPVTASIGLTVAVPSDLDLDDPLARADAALYRAKGEGRNRVRAAIADAPVSAYTGTCGT